MSDYLIIGKKGTGKSKFSVQKIHQYLREGRRVATNIDLYLEYMCSPMSRATVIRLPDKPLQEDLELIGLGNEEVDEEKNGGLFCDEAATWLNARTFNDKGRAGFIDFCIHGRKLGWDMWLMCQNIGQIDRQVREALVEYLVRCMRLDKVRIPVIGGMLKFLTGGKFGALKGVHYASIRLMEMPDIKIDGEYYKAKFYERCYNTRQKFREWVRDPADPRFKDEIYVGPYTMLSAWHLKGRHEKQKAPGLFESFVRALFRIGQSSADVSPVRKHPMVQLLMGLPPDERIRHFKRLQAAGAI